MPDLIRKRVIALVGPTCTGKTPLSIYLAEKLSAEIIACDSRTVYKYFDIGTAKPSNEEQALVRHHLIDVVEPEEDFTVSEFTRLAKLAIDDIHSRNKTVIVCGGTGFYARALLEGLSIPDVAPQEELRTELTEFAEKEGNAALHKRLAELDPDTALRVNVNDRFRMLRALEVTITMGQPFSQLVGRKEPSYETLWLGLNFAEREKHRDLINMRIDKQMEDGMLNEARLLFERYGPSQKLLKTVNYRDLVEHIQGLTDWQNCLVSCQIHNYQLARRQHMWFKTNNLINWFNIDQMPKEEIQNSALALSERFLG